MIAPITLYIGGKSIDGNLLCLQLDVEINQLQSLISKLLKQQLCHRRELPHIKQLQRQLSLRRTLRFWLASQ
ncbi:hypothetical protein EDC56_1936 [Sinobacterium caligoides]|uniref:Uncharacterized protein n=1 Tax=Sinobacterium caligoides TaxID=933926 RepID=A0A3N2DNV0_9GAMM|nr:hypothetical protein [Sinobacterium caligoides]ROS01494.1 hypothetical protein EDC56_1936 [Sinobacterium caligoides]